MNYRLPSGWDSVGPMFPLEGPEPRQLPSEVSPVQPFTPDLLPDALRTWIIDIAERMQCPPDFAAVGAVTALSSLIGARVRIQPKAYDDWTVTPNLWGMGVGLPGIMKSPAWSEVIRPMERLQDEFRSDWQARHDLWEIEQKRAELTTEVNERKAKKLLGENTAADVSNLLTKITVGAEPRRRRLVVIDTSLASLMDVLDGDPWGILAYRDELSGLLKSLNKQGQEEARAFYLQAFDGDKRYTVNRAGFTRELPCACISMLGGIQPGRITKYVRSALSGGDEDDGLLQRFQLAVWPEINGSFTNIDRPVNTIACDRAYEVYRRLAELPPPVGQLGSLLRFDGAAQISFDEWRVPFEKRLRTDGMHPAMQSHLSKYRKLVPALALVFEMADNSHPQSVSLASLERALRWAEYLETHAARLYAATDTSDAAAAKALLDVIRNGKLRSEFSLRDVYLNGWRHLSSPDTVRRAATMLKDYGWLRRTERHTKGRPAEVYTAHPLALKGKA